MTGASLGGGIASRLLDWAMTRGAGRVKAPWREVSSAQ